MRKFPLILTALVIALMLATFWSTAAAQDIRETLRFCESGAYSTEEDFMSENTPDGNPYISDGDLLSVSGQVCARNYDLVQRGFDVSVDVGLDAVHIVDFGEFGDPLIAFSTELDSPFGNFGAGDLLFTNGAVIPNEALTREFGIAHDVGLDGLEIFGETERIVELANNLPSLNDPFWQERSVNEILRQFEVEIWFSVEGTFSLGEREFVLDGDILSTDGSIIARNGDLLPPDVPAGIPERGVDFGADAIAVVTNPETGSREILYSTELLFNGRERTFTDGDVLRQGDGTVFTNDALIEPFKPRADFLGLDALWLPGEIELQPVITTMCERDVNNFNGGIVLAGDAGAYTGLWRANYGTTPPGDDPRRPCGAAVPIDGPREPLQSMTRFRVAYRPFGSVVPAVGTAPAIQTRWYLPRGHWSFNIFVGWQWVCPEVNTSNPATYQILETDSNGWMDASDFLDAESGLLTGCTPPELRLAVWNSASVPASDPSFDPDGHYVIWMEWDDGSLHRENADHHLQLDNTAPELPAYPDALQVRLMDGETIIPACGEIVSASEFQVWGQFYDEHYWYFTLALYGGDPPGSLSSAHNYYDPDDGTPGIKNTNDTGTTPTGQLVHLRNIDMTLLGESFDECCYMLMMYVYDAAILHSFNGTYINAYSEPHRSGPAFLTFSVSP